LIVHERVLGGLAFPDEAPTIRRSIFAFVGSDVAF
jgi:hypothetical protein